MCFAVQFVVITGCTVFFLMLRGSCSPFRSFRPSLSSLLFPLCSLLFALSSLLLLEENEVYCKYKEYYRYKVVPLQCLSLEQYRYYHAEYKA